MLAMWVLFKPSSDQKLISLVPKEEYSIKELAEAIAEATGLEGIEFDTSKADGQHRKTMSAAVLTNLLPAYRFTPLSQGIAMTVHDFK